ncbi:MAG: protein phosphatase CheZ [Sphingomonadales bacterium]|nr:protein phosphatase CheZ [Sphingomonadales bacterium]
MDTQALPKQIEALVDHLRAEKESQPTLTDVAAVTEVLIDTMQRYFRSIDTTIYKEFVSLSDYIENARSEIVALTPDADANARIPRAGLELDAIVQQTESATNTIMEATEDIMSANANRGDDADPDVDAAALKIFEACSFQDITGQRISKVVETLTHIEGRLDEVKSVMGITSEEIAAAQPDELDKSDPLARGPALEGEGIDQNEVDALMGGEADANGEADAASEAAPAGEDPVEAEPDTAEAAEAAPEAAEADAPAETADLEIEGDAAPEGKTTSQEEIDALFG